MLNYLKFLYHFVAPVIDLKRALRSLPFYLSYFLALRRYKSMDRAEKIKLTDLYPILNDKVVTQSLGGHYFYQDIWAFKNILLDIDYGRIEFHVDVGSRVDFIGFLTAITKVIYVDIRALEVNLKNFEYRKGNILKMPFEDSSILSLSSLHVAEHVGLGRYGDGLNPRGTEQACKELERVLAKGGRLYFSVPIGRPRLCYNAHRIHSSQQIMEYFDGLELVEFAGIDDNSCFYPVTELRQFDECQYGCGLFLFTKT